MIKEMLQTLYNFKIVSDIIHFQESAICGAMSHINCNPPLGRIRIVICFKCSTKSRLQLFLLSLMKSPCIFVVLPGCSFLNEHCFACEEHGWDYKARTIVISNSAHLLERNVLVLDYLFETMVLVRF